MRGLSSCKARPSGIGTCLVSSAARSRAPANPQTPPRPLPPALQADRFFRFGLRPWTAILAPGRRPGGALPPDLAAPDPWLAPADDDGAGFSDDDGFFAPEGDDGTPPAGTGGGLELVQAARRVEAATISYARSAKQVDVKALKECMWAGMQTERAGGRGADPAHPVHLQALLDRVPAAGPAGALADISVHLAFICVLHLTNEHGLVIQGAPDLRQFDVSGIPQAGQ